MGTVAPGRKLCPPPPSRMRSGMGNPEPGADTEQDENIGLGVGWPGWRRGPTSPRLWAQGQTPGPQRQASWPGGGVSHMMGGAHLQEGDNGVPGDGLQQARGPGQALQAGPTGGEEGADDDDPG